MEWLRRIRFFGVTGLIYAATVLCLFGAATAPARALTQSRQQTAALLRAIARSTPKPNPSGPLPLRVSGRPVRIVIPDSAVDLPVDPGYYDSITGNWTLSGYRAQFAMMSTPANNLSGDTFIYGHNNNFVFGALRHRTPTPGATALLYTDNNHIFAYSFVNSSSYSPDDTSVLTYTGPSMLTIQTCTGSLNEWRTMYRFVFKDIQQ